MLDPSQASDPSSTAPGAAAPGSGPPLPRGRDIALAGFVVTAVTFGPGRIAFGLHLPQLRSEFGISEALAGLVSGGVFAALLLGAVAASWLNSTVGPRIAVLAGCAAAAAGLGVAATAGNATTLAAGVVVAGLAAGLTWSPFNDEAARALPEERRGTPLSLVSTGTTAGIAVAGALQVSLVLVGFDWRAAWVAYAGFAVGAAVLAWWRLPPLGGRPGESGATPAAVHHLGRRLLWPVVVAVSFGATSSLWFAFAADRTASEGGLPGMPGSASAGVLFVAYGVAGLAGLTTARVEQRSGLRLLLVGVFSASAVSLALVALVPATWVGALVGASLQGVATMTVSALLSYWTARLFPAQAATAFTVVVVALAAGGVAGPAAAGVLIAGIGAATVFLAAAGLSVVTGAALALAHPPHRADPV